MLEFVFNSFATLLVVVNPLGLASILLATRIMRLFGETGANVLTRVLLAALAVQFVLTA